MFWALPENATVTPGGGELESSPCGCFSWMKTKEKHILHIYLTLEL